jgi:periplasmic protein TonB
MSASDKVNHEKRWVWLMLLVSAAIHIVLGIVATFAPAHIEHSDTNRHLTIVSVQPAQTLSPADSNSATADSAVEPAPLEPSLPAMERRPEELAMDNVPTLPEPPAEPQVSDEVNRVVTGPKLEQQPSTASSKPVERQQLSSSINVPTTVDDVPAPSRRNPSTSRRPNDATSAGGNRTGPTGNRVSPRYPRQLWEREIEGSVDVLASVDDDGHVTEVKIHKSSGYDAFDEAALEAVRQWRDLPRGQDVVVPIEFRIRR